ncbi:MAG: HAMP domain-containing protein [Boseongicola sp.]|nr:MAG: HAMP domain-containing protein [Boseongicola sp.]
MTDSADGSDEAGTATSRNYQRGSFGRSVQTKFLLYVVPLVLASTFIVFGLFELNARRSAEAQLQEKLEKLVEIQSAVVAESLWNVADGQIKLILTALLTDSDVLGAAVYDERDRLVAEAGETSTFGETRFVALEDILYDAGDQEVKIGALRIALNETRLGALARERLSLVVLLASILLAAVIAATLTANRRIIGRPLGLMMDTINQQRSDAPRKPVNWTSDDEIGRVVSAFNEMQERQNAYEHQLRSSNDELEQRVEERTAELVLAEVTATEARGLLTDAIASISEGFALYDKSDKLVVANQRYREIMWDDGETELPSGTPFEDVLKHAAGTERFPNATANREEWIERQIGRHRSAGTPFRWNSLHPGTVWQSMAAGQQSSNRSGRNSCRPVEYNRDQTHLR